MAVNGLPPIFLTALCALFGVLCNGNNLTELKIREGFTHYLLPCYNHGSDLNSNKRITWFHSDAEFTAPKIPAAFDADKVTLVASWDGADIFISDATAWTLDDYQNGWQYSLRIKNTSFPRDNGFFYCVDQESRDIIRRLHLVVLVQISEVSIIDSQGTSSGTVIVTESEMTQLSCKVNRANPAPMFKWTIDYHPIDNAVYPLSGDSNTGLLKFTPTREMNGGVVRCMVTNDNGPAVNAETKLNVLFSPRVTVQWQSGTNVLTCDAEGNPAQYQFQQWRQFVRGTLVDSLDGNSSGGTSVLHLPPDGYLNTGHYVCVVSNGIGKPQNASFLIEPKTPPVFEVRSRDILAAAGSRVDLTAGFYSNPVFSYLVWEKAETDATVKMSFHEVKPAYPTLNFKGTSAHVPGNITTLPFSNVKVEDSGIYTVIVKNTVGMSSYTITLTVKDLQNKADQQTTVPVKEDINVDQQPLARENTAESAARQDKLNEDPVPADSNVLVATVSCISVVVIILVVVGVCLVRHGKISIYGCGQQTRDSQMSKHSPSLESDDTLSGENKGDNSDMNKSTSDDLYPSSVSNHTDSTSASLNTISDTRVPIEHVLPAVYPLSISLTGQAYLPTGSLQSMV